MAVLAQMKLLISLAQIDGVITTQERNYIINIGRANGFYPDEVAPLLERRHELIVPDHLTPEQKFNYIFTLILLMKIDKRMYREEVMFCTKIAENLGYASEVMSELLAKVNSAGMTDDDLIALKNITQKYLTH